MNNIDFLMKYGVEPESFKLLSEAARNMVDNAEPDMVFLVFFNQIANRCKQNGIDVKEFFGKMIDDLQSRNSSLQTPEDYLNLFPDDDLTS